MTLTRLQARQQLYDDGAIGPAVGWYGTASGGSTTALNDPVRFGSSLRGPTYFQGQGRVVLPGRASADRERDSGRVTQAGSLTLAGPALSVAVSNGETYEFVRRGLHWDQLNAAWAEALRHVYWETTTPVSQVLRDGDLNGLETDAWLPSDPDVTFDYSGASEHNLTGHQSLRITFGGALDTNYLSQAQPWSLPDNAHTQVYLAGLVRVLSGTAYWDVYNESTGLRLGERVIIDTANHWWHVGGVYTATAGGNHNLRLGGDHGTVVVWDAFPNHYINGLSWPTPAWLEANWQLRRLEEYTYARNISRGLDEAHSRQYTSWRPRLDYTPENLAEEASPNRLQVLPPRRSLPAHDLFYRGLRPVSDVWVESESNPTHGSDVMLYAAFAVEVLALLETRDHLGPQGRWQALQRDYQATVDTQRAARQDAAMAPQPRRSVTVV